MTATYTTVERLALFLAGLVFAAVAAFGVIHVASNRHLFPQNEVVGTVGLYWAAVVLLFGVWMIANWRRKERERAPFDFFASMITDAKAVSLDRLTEADILRITGVKSSSDYHLDDLNEDGSLSPHARTDEDFRVAPIDEHGYIDFGKVSGIMLQRHLTDALAVLLREPSLTIDAGTLAMLAKHKAKAARVRGADGKLRKVQ